MLEDKLAVPSPNSRCLQNLGSLDLASHRPHRLFRQRHLPPISLFAGQSTAFNVFFAPATTGTLSGTVTVTSNASNSPTTIKLSGSGATSTVHSVTLSWTPSSTIFTGFDIYRGTTSGGPYTVINSSLTPSFTDTTVTSGQTYYYVVTEIDTSGDQSIYSDQASAVIP